MSATSKTIAWLCGLALAAGGTYWLFAGGGATAVGDAAARSAQDSPSVSAGGAATERESVGAVPTSAAEGAGSERDAGGGAARGEVGPRRVTEAEKASVRDLIKQHPVLEPPEGVHVEARASVATPWPVDDDSLFLKHGGRDRAGLEAECVSIQAILDWQGSGPFESKESDLMPPGMLHAFEVELEWLRQRLQEF
jgi:hypothetical protein